MKSAELVKKRKGKQTAVGDELLIYVEQNDHVLCHGG
jgi:hypothetical protein